MEHDSNTSPTAVGYMAGPVTKVPDWHGLVAWDLLFNGLTTGLYLVAVLSELALPEVFAATARWAYPVALLFMIADLICLVLDLGDPLRFHHMLRVFKPSSPMSLGTWCLVVYSLPLTVAAGWSLLSEGGTSLDWARKATLLLGFLPALATAAYKGVLLSTNAQPGWKDARWLGGYLANSALVLGCAGMLVLAVFLGQERAAAILRTALGLLLVLNMIPLGLLLADLRPVLAQIFTPVQRARASVLILGGGVVIPIGLLLAGDNDSTMLVAVSLILLVNLIIRFLIIKIPHASSSAGQM
jgi:Ni/Fe-hydrogenase subunit HybB-like protein